MTDQIPIAGHHRNVALHAGQSPSRLAVVKAAIDKVYATGDVQALFAWAGDPQHPPESRLLAAALVEAGFEIAAEKREVRPDVDLDLLRSCIASLSSRQWQDPDFYCSLLDPPAAPGMPGPAPRELPLDDDRQ